MNDHPYKAAEARGWRARARAWVASRPVGWRLGVPVVCACAGLLGASSMINARGTDLRGGRHTDLIGVVSEQTASVRGLRQTVEQLQSQVDTLAEQVRGTHHDELSRKLADLESPAGLAGLTGPGLAIALDDAPLGQLDTEDIDPNLLVVHQQDIQAVVNALWAGGAEGMSLQGQRIVSTTGIKCVGNTVVLQGVPYSPPYRIVATGDTGVMYDALQASPEVQAYLDYTVAPYNLGWTLRDDPVVTLRPYSGPLGLDFARLLTLPGD